MNYINVQLLKIYKYLKWTLGKQMSTNLRPCLKKNHSPKTQHNLNQKSKINKKLRSLANLIN